MLLQNNYHPKSTTRSPTRYLLRLPAFPRFPNPTRTTPTPTPTTPTTHPAVEVINPHQKTNIMCESSTTWSLLLHSQAGFRMRFANTSRKKVCSRSTPGALPVLLQKIYALSKRMVEEVLRPECPSCLTGDPASQASGTEKHSSCSLLRLTPAGTSPSRTLLQCVVGNWSARELHIATA